MKKITSNIVHAFLEGKTRSIDNSSTDGERLYLFGNRIAWKGDTITGGVFITLAGWDTPTTRERLNGVLAAMGHKRVLDGDLVLGIWTQKTLTFIGHHTVGTLPGEAPESLKQRWFGASETLFIAHPDKAKGLDAVSPALREEATR